MKKLQIIGYLFALLLITCNAFAEGSQGEQLQTYSNRKWGFSFTYPRSWDLYSNRSFTEMTHGLWNVPNAVVIVVNKNDPEENFFVKAIPAPNGTIPKSALQDMIKSLDQAYQQQYQGFRKIQARIVEIAGARGIEYLMDSERECTKLRQMVLILIKNRKFFIWTFTAPRDRYGQVSKKVFEGVISNLQIK